MSFDNDFAGLINRIQKSVHSLAAERIDKIVREVLHEVLVSGTKVAETKTSRKKPTVPTGSWAKVPASKVSGTKYADRVIDGQKKREAVFQTVYKNASSLHEITTNTGLNRDVVKYHLNILRKEERVKTSGSKRNIIYHT